MKSYAFAATRARRSWYRFAAVFLLALLFLLVVLAWLMLGVSRLQAAGLLHYVAPGGSGSGPCTIGAPCNQCPDCIRVEARSHPDWFEMEAEHGPIKIEAVRRLSHEWSYRSFEGGFRCALLDNAERMTPEAANALLKILEEPPANSIFFISRTISSDCCP